MSTKNFQSFNNYIHVADSNKHNLSLYFYIKNFCFRKMIGLVSHDKNSFLPAESQIIENTLKEFKAETQSLSIPPLTKEQFCEFLERFYSQCNFDSTDASTFEMCKDITEILSIYGPYDDLAKQRMDFFNKKIGLLEKPNANRVVPNPKPSSGPENAQKQVPDPKQNIREQENKRPGIFEEDDIANKLLTSSVATHIQESNKNHSSDYIPKRVNKSVHLPVIKSTPEYKIVKEEIIANIEDGICELEYFNIDHAKEYVESALYYLKNIIEKK